MPRFNKQEKYIIREHLLEEGEKLFSVHGLQKVTINDLTASVGISHGAFYTFFENKEHLFMEINIKKQREIFERVESLICDNKTLHPYKLAKLVFNFLMREFFADPIISSINSEVWEHIIRRIPKETVESHNLSDSFVVEKLTEVGVRFKFNASLVVKTVQAVFMIATSIALDEDSEEIMEIIIDGIIEKLVESKG